MPGSIIASGARTPIGKLAGALAGLSAMDLGGIAIAGALERAGISPEQVDYVFMGHVLQAGQGQITARQAAAKANIAMTVPSTTVNKVCLSGLNALYLADLMISAGEADVVIAGGMESMTNAPYILPGVRAGLRLGDSSVVDSMMFDGLTCAFDGCAMGLATERGTQELGISRERQDAFSAMSHERAAAAAKSNRLSEEIVSVDVPQRKGEPIVVDTDEGIRPGTTADSLSALRPAFDKSGTVTAGNSSQISDGAAALVVVSRTKAEQLGITPLGELVGYGQVAGPGTSLLHQPSHAISRALEKSALTTDQVDLFEINEAFAAVTLASTDDLGVSDDIVNVNGGAVALGHPIGMSGARLVLTSLLELRRRNAHIAAVGLCGGGGQGDAAVVRSIA